MTFDIRQFLARLMNAKGTCAALGCQDRLNPSRSVHINGATFQACEGHGCSVDHPCIDCRLDAR